MSLLLPGFQGHGEDQFRRGFETLRDRDLKCHTNTPTAGNVQTEKRCHNNWCQNPALCCSTKASCNRDNRDVLVGSWIGIFPKQFSNDRNKNIKHMPIRWHDESCYVTFGNLIISHVSRVLVTMCLKPVQNHALISGKQIEKFCPPPSTTPHTAYHDVSSEDPENVVEEQTNQQHNGRLEPRTTTTNKITMIPITVGNNTNSHFNIRMNICNWSWNCFTWILNDHRGTEPRALLAPDRA